ncbi:MAG: hypothetical protein U0599_16365 [Vicinamibacteria bacterium]
MKGRRFSSGRAWALSFLAACGAVVALTLGGQSERVAVREPIVPRLARGPLVRVPFAPASGAGPRAASIRLSVNGPAGLFAHDEVRLFVSTPGGGPLRVRRAELRGSGGCRFEAGAVVLAEDEPLPLRRAAACPASGVTAVDLAVETEDGAAPGLWAYRPRPGLADRGPLLVDGADGEGPLSVRAFVVDWPETAPRIELLSAMWRRAGSSGWLWGLLASGLGLVLVGCAVLPAGPAPTAGGPEGRFVLASGSGAALVAGGLALLYVVATPPLSGPDEPYHLMGLSVLAGQPTRIEDTLAWCAETHQMRIRRHPQERFRTVDVGRPEAAEDPEARPTEAAMRSAALAAGWVRIAPAFAGATTPQVLLGIRLLNALAFAAALGAAAALAAWSAAAVAPQWIPLSLLVVPTLPFFAMHVSETALLCAVYALLGTSVAVMFLDGPRAHAAGLPLGLACGIMLAGGRSPWPLAAVVGAALAARVLLGPAPGSPRRAGPVFWGGFGAGALAFYALLNPEYAVSLTALSTRSPRLQPAVEHAFASPWPLVVVVLLGLGLEASLSTPRARLASALGRPARSLAGRGASSLAALVVLSLVASLVLPLPDFPLEPSHPLTLRERLVSVLATSATLFRLREPNFLLGTSFWVGFGWLDTIPGPAFQAFVVVLVAAATVALLLGLARPPQARRAAFLALLAAGGAASLALYTIVTQGEAMALHGRYLIGWYLVFLAIAGCGVAGVGRAEGNGTKRLARAAPALLLVALGAIHTYCLCFILRRYF